MVLTNTNGIGAMNPFRYRGYYLDTETNLYYLQTRYYDPLTGRFINSDGQLNGGLIGDNMFAYCENDPVNRIDSTGRFWVALMAVAIAVACPIIFSGCSSAQSVLGAASTINDAYDKANDIKTVVEMYNDLENANKAKFLAANDVLHKAADPNYVIDVSGVSKEYQQTYVQQIERIATNLNSCAGLGIFNTFDKFKKEKITSLGSVSYEEAQQFMNEISILTSGAKFFRASPYIADFLEKGVDLLSSTIRWD